MKFSFKFFMVLVMIFSIALWSGCSDDDEGTDSQAKTAGNAYDMGYLMFKGLLLDIEMTDIDRIKDLLDLYEMIKNHPPKSAPNDPPVYHSDSKYWYYEHLDTTFYGIEIGYDSVQFLHSGVAVDIPDSALLTEIRGGVMWLLIDTATAGKAAATAAGDTLYTAQLTLDIVGTAGEIDGGGDVTISFNSVNEGLPPGLSSDCDWNTILNGTATGLTINLTTDNCPTAGNILYSGTMVMACPSPLPSYSNTWTARETFADGEVSWHIENESYYWDSDGYCSWYLMY